MSKEDYRRIRQLVFASLFVGSAISLLVYINFVDNDWETKPWVILLVGFFITFLLSIIVMLSLRLRLASRKQKHAQAVVESTQRLESLGVLTSGIAHDFNNLLAVILGNAALAHKHLRTHSQEHVFVSHIEQASKKAADLCRQMLVYAGKGHFIVKGFDLSAMVKEMTSLMEISLSKDVSIHYDLANNLDYIEVDAAQVQQLIMNLITNANEAMEGRSGRVLMQTKAVTLDQYFKDMLGAEPAKPGHYICLEVSDEGCGMDEETKRRIFEPFFTTKITGRGLGMSAMLSTVKNHEGMIQVHSKVGDGTTFQVFFPAIDKEAYLEALSTTEPHWYAEKKPFGKILLVDDEEIVLETMQVMLQDLGYEVLLAEDGLQALEIYQQHQHDICLVLMDMTMPKMGGKTCTAELQKINPEVKIILSSGYTEEDISKQFNELNLAGIVQKPFDLDQLNYAVTKALGFH